MKYRLLRDPIFFLICLAFLGFLTVSLAITWWLFGDLLLLVLAVLSLPPAFWLFYVREQALAETRKKQPRR